MRKVIEIIGVEHRVSKASKHYAVTHVLVDDGTECQVYGTNIAVGDEVEVYFHYNKVKARKKPQKA